MITVSAPGSTFLMGEHAVLHGEHALIGALNRRITLSAERTSDRMLRIDSDRFGEFCGDISALEVTGPFRFLICAVKRFGDVFEEGLSLRIASEIDPNQGLGSSAAVVVCVSAALLALAEGTRASAQIFSHARSVIQSVQGRGSGGDVAASVFGGVQLYAMNGTRKTIDNHFPFSLIYSGYKTPTPKVITAVLRKSQRFPALYQDLYQTLGDITRRAAVAMAHGDRNGFALLMEMHHGLQMALGVGTPELSELYHDVLTLPGVNAAKISGSGLGDCLLALGNVPRSRYPRNVQDERKQYRVLDLQLTNEGVIYA